MPLPFLKDSLYWTHPIFHMNPPISRLLTGHIILGGSTGRESACNVGDLGLIPGLRRSPGEGNSYPLQYSGLENSMDYSPWGRQESDTNEGLSLTLSNRTWNNGLFQNWERSMSRLSPCLFNFYAEYIMRNVRLDESQAGIKIARRDINNLRYADDITLMAESEKELKSLLVKVKESGKAGLNSTFKKQRSWHLVPSLHGK